MNATDWVRKSESSERWTKVVVRQTTALCEIMHPPHSFELLSCVAQRGCGHTGLQQKNAGSSFAATQCNILRQSNMCNHTFVVDYFVL